MRSLAQRCTRWLGQTSARLDSRCLRGHIELDLFPDDASRLDALRRVGNRAYRSRRFWGMVVRSAGIIGGASALFAWFLHGYGIVDFAAAYWLCGCTTAIMFGVAGDCGTRRCVLPLLREELLARQIPICVPCGYPLQGLPGPNCPECGRPFDQKVLDVLCATTQHPLRRIGIQGRPVNPAMGVSEVARSRARA